MKKYIASAFVALSFMVVGTSCGDFGDVNVDPENLNEGNVPYGMVFSNAQHQALGSDWDVWRNGVIYASQWNQHIAAGGWYWSYGINSFSDGYSSAYWDGVYSGSRGAVRDVTTVLDIWKDQEGMEANYQLARIMRVYVMSRLTDLYGDIPYSEAGRPSLYSYPKYDTQESIYADMLKELDEAQAALGSGEAPMRNQDLYYSGDLSKWKKFANSLMLRLGMRMCKVDPTAAQTWVAKAYANGVITETSDNCYLMHEGGSVNDDSSEPYAKIFIQSDPGVAFISRTFLTKLQELNDPRIPLIMGVYPEAASVAYTNQNYSFGTLANCAPEVQKGMPGCFSMSESSNYSIAKYYGDEFTTEVLSDESSDKFYKKVYSQPNRWTYADPTGPTFVVTAAQTNLLLAEAAYRGWISGSAESFYNKGVRCAMEQFSQYPNTQAATLCSLYLTESAISQYLAENPFNTATALEQINTQYWITCFCDEYETFANWRRSGYPELPNLCDMHDNFASTGNYNGQVRRFTYPLSEVQINTANYQEALARMGKTNENDFDDSRVWWDAK